MSVVSARVTRNGGRFRAVTIQQRVRLLALVGMAATLTVAGVAFVTLQRSRTLTQRVAVVSAGDRLFLANQEVREEIVGRVTEILYLTVDSPDADAVEASAELRDWVQELNANNQDLARLDLPDNLATATRSVAAAIDAFASSADVMLGRTYSGARADAQRGLAQFLAVSDSIDRDATAIPFRSEIDRLNAQAGNAQQRAVLLLWAATAFAVAMLIVGAHWVARRIRKALRDMSLAAGRMTTGDLTTRVEHDTDDEVGQLANSFNTLASTLAQTFERIEADASRESFNTRLVEALDMVDAEGEVYETVSRAMGHAGPHAMELLLSDSSRAHLERSASHPVAGAPGCTVGSPFQCVAVRRGNPVVFESSTELNACPKLRDRPVGDVSAACVPVSFMGRALGVVHATSPDRQPPTHDVVARLGQLAALAGSRIGTVRAFQQSQLQAATDALTGLANRRTAEAQVRELFAEGKLFSFVMADLDFFKRLNDSHGHEIGDRALRLFARVFGESLRSGDTAARWGGEEFAAILHGVRADEAVNVLERLRARLADAALTGETPAFTASFGVIDSATVGNLELLIRTADDALYAAKEAGRDRIVIGDPVLIAPTGRLRSVEHDARIDTSSLVMSTMSAVDSRPHD
jgi:diguanylate cyclase (GGDEF)-like protein